VLVATFFFLKQPARGAFLTKKLLPRLHIPRSLLCSRTVQKSNARSRAEATLPTKCSVATQLNAGLLPSGARDMFALVILCRPASLSSIEASHTRSVLWCVTTALAPRSIPSNELERLGYDHADRQ